MRAGMCVSAALIACGLAALSAQAPPTPVVRAGVDLLEVDVSVVNADSEPTPDLSTAEFTVTVDGQPRRVASAQYISDASPAAPTAVDPYVSTNTDRRPGRLIVLVIDQNNITRDGLRTSLSATRGFIGALAPNDRIALAPIPASALRVDFTTNHRQVEDALSSITPAPETESGKFNISNYEALAFDSTNDVGAVEGMMLRLCGDNTAGDVSTCTGEAAQEAAQTAQRIRFKTSQSLASLTALLKDLADIEGPKALILLSQGLMMQAARSDAGAIADLAVEAHASINVLLLDGALPTASDHGVSSTPSQDRDLREAGLNTLAVRSRGALFHGGASPDAAFRRIASELGGHYVLAIEPLAADRDGKAHDIKVQVVRKGLLVRAPQQLKVVPRNAGARSREVLMGRVLGSPSVATQIPMRLATYTYRDETPQSQKQKLVVAVELNPPVTGQADVAMGFALFDQLGRTVSSGIEPKVYPADTQRPLRYEAALSVSPGPYRLRFAAIDSAGNAGSVDRSIQVRATAGQDVALGDLMLASLADTRDGTIHPPVLLETDEGQVRTFAEIYSPQAGSLDGAEAAFEVADGPDAPALKTESVRFRPRPDGTSAVASVDMAVGSLPPGRYMMRAIVTSGGKTVGRTVRPFVVKSGGAGARTAGSGSAPGGAATPALRSDSGLVVIKPVAFKREDALQPDMLRVALDAMEKNHPTAKSAVAKARTGQFEGTALLALDAGDQDAVSLLRGLELLAKGQLDPAAAQFLAAQRNAPDTPLASFYLGVCYASAGRDREAVGNWERSKAAQLKLPVLPFLMGDAYLRLGQPAQAAASLSDALALQPQNDGVRRTLALTQSTLGQHAQAFATVTPYLDRNANDADALLVALQALYEVHAAGKSIRSAAEDRDAAVAYGKAYAAAGGPHQALVDKWVQFLGSAVAAAGGAK